MRLRFGKRSHIAARNLLRLHAEIDELQEFLIDEGFEELLPNHGHVPRAATEKALVHYLGLLIDLAASYNVTRPEASA
jgi:hypothetical protein